LRIISLFCGCGGADLGISGGFNYLATRYAKNAVEFIHASDIDAKAIATYNNNFDHGAQVADIRDLSFKHLQADLVVGGFPCQSFSSVNPTKDPTDSRGQLFNEMIRVVRETRPKYVIGENVKGFYRLHKGAYFEDFSRKLRRAGYAVYHQVMNAADFGVPQLRERLIVVGIRRDISQKFDFPKPIAGPKAATGRAYVPLRAIVKSLSGVPDRYYFSKRAVEGVKRAKPNMKRALAQDLDQPCLTVTSHLAKVSLNSRDPVLLVKKATESYRRFTPGEAAAIQAFPPTFHFVGSEGDAYRQIGNAIPPVLIWHIFRSLQELDRKNKGRR
jgi:DNA (cytosine-5)-methyltransferase 1